MLVELCDDCCCLFPPGDRVVFAESSSAPGVPIVYRTPEERSANPDRLNLDRSVLIVLLP